MFTVLSVPSITNGSVVDGFDSMASLMSSKFANGKLSNCGAICSSAYDQFFAVFDSSPPKYVPYTAVPSSAVIWNNCGTDNRPLSAVFIITCSNRGVEPVYAIVILVPVVSVMSPVGVSCGNVWSSPFGSVIVMSVIVTGVPAASLIIQPFSSCLLA